jgi:hypothetical protein
MENKIHVPNHQPVNLFGKIRGKPFQARFKFIIFSLHVAIWRA